MYFDHRFIGHGARPCGSARIDIAMGDEGVIPETGILRCDRVAPGEAPRGGVIGRETIWRSRQVDRLMLLAFDACADHDVVRSNQARELAGESFRRGGVSGVGQTCERYVE